MIPKKEKVVKKMDRHIKERTVTIKVERTSCVFVSS